MMSNEELAAAIQNGREDLYAVLWEQVRGFVAQQANRRYYATAGYGGIEVEDLIQSGFLALIEAVRFFNPAGEYKFLTYLGNCLKNAFASAGTYSTSKRDPLNDSLSLDMPLSDDPDGDTLLNLQADPRDDYEEVEHQLWLEQLRATLNKAIKELPEEQQAVIRSRYQSNLTLQAVAKEREIDLNRVRNLERKGLTTLHRRSSVTGLKQFIEDRTPYYVHVGLKAFTASGTSAVEMAVMKRESLRKFISVDEFAEAGNS